MARSVAVMWNSAGAASGGMYNQPRKPFGFSAAGLIGPFTSGFAIDHLGHLNAFMLLSTFSVVPLLLLWFKPGFLPKAAKSTHDTSQQRVLDLWKMPKLRSAFIASGILSATWDLFQFYFPIYGHSIGLSASVIGAVLATFALATFIVRIILPAWARRTSEAEILVKGIPLFFGSVGTAFGFVPVFMSNAAMLVAGGEFLRRRIK